MVREILTKRLVVDVADDGGMAVYVARPKAGDKLPGLLLFQEAFGVNEHIRDVAQRFAREGFVVHAPELYHRTAPGFQGNYEDAQPSLEHMKKLTTAGLQADFRSAHQALSSVKGVDASNISAVGFCMGGRAAFLAAATVPLRAAVSFYGGRIPDILDQAAKLSCPLLLVWGGQDPGIPPAQIAQVTQALRDHKKDFVNAEWSFAGHGFHCDARAGFQPVAARQAWDLTLSFLKKPR